MEDNKNKVVFVPYPPLEKTEGEPMFSVDILDMTPEEYLYTHKYSKG